MMKRVLMAAAGVGALFAAACETTSTQTAGTSSSEAQRIAELEAQLAAAEARAAGTTVSAQSASVDAIATAAGYPPDALPGQCFARVLVPEITQVVAESVVDTPERTEIQVIPASYDFVEEQVLIREESVEYEVIPARYETVTEQVVVQEQTIERTVIPASYEEYEERVLVRPAYTTWKPGAGLFGRPADGASLADANGQVLPTGELLCKVEVPAEYRTVTRRRLVSAERTEEQVIPAKFETVTKRVVAEAPQVIERVIPAQYETVRVRRVVEEAREEMIVIPASFRTQERVEVVGGGDLEWREVLCDTNATPETIAQVQQALNDRGYALGRADGVFGASTLRAMESFQRDNGLIVGQLTRETVEALDVPFVTVAG